MRDHYSFVAKASGRVAAQLAVPAKGSFHFNLAGCKAAQNVLRWQRPGGKLNGGKTHARPAKQRQHRAQP
jgi:hypothetical protein